MLSKSIRGPALVSRPAGGYPTGRPVRSYRRGDVLIPSPGPRPGEGPARPAIHWPAVGGAAAFCAVFITGLTLAAALVSRPAGAGEASGPWPALSDEGREETVAPPAAGGAAGEAGQGEAGPPDLAPLVPDPPRPGAGLEQVVASAAASVPTTVPNPWRPVPAPEPPAERVAVKRPPVTCDTSVEFVSSPVRAAKQAQQEHKLLFLLHLSGDFEEPGFT
jgi:hypothetical protein